MLKLYLTLRHLWADKRGVTAIEYAVLAGAVAVAIVAVFDNGVLDKLGTVIGGALDETVDGGGGDDS